jgi:hypothetical protein
MRLASLISVALSLVLVEAYGFVRPHALAASHDEYAAYYQGVDEDDEDVSDEPPLPDEPDDEMPAEEATDDEILDDEAPAAKSSADNDPRESDESDEVPPEEMPDDAPENSGPSTPLMEDDDDVPVQVPPRYPSTLPYEQPPTPKYDDGKVRPRESATSKLRQPGASCCRPSCCGADVACCEKPSCCHAGGLGQGRIWHRLFGRSSAGSCCCNSCCRVRGTKCCCQEGHPSCCGSASAEGGHEAPPAPPEAYDGSTVKSTRKSAAVALQHWDMPRMTSSGRRPSE